MTGYPDFYFDFVGRSIVVVPVPKIGYNSDSEQYKSGYAHFKKIRLKTLALTTGFSALGGIYATFFLSL